ncbi:MAG TPA: hypothetical protein DCY55_00050 [Gammaproteobacteria bacterium]|nr:hypothetical protein [Gammaproteobacteria bacterium]
MLCGKADVRNNIDPADIVSEVQLDSWALTTLLSGQEIVFDPWAEPRWGESVSSTNKWAATEDDAEHNQAGIFRFWSASLTDPDAFPFPEIFNPTLTVCYPMEISQQGIDIHILLEEYAALRVVHMDSNVAVEEQPLSHLGYSIGRWDVDTLVVETSRGDFPHFNTIGIPQGPGATFVEQFIPSEDGKTLSYKLTVTDPTAFTEPVELTKRRLALPDAKVEPYDCAI